MNKEKQKKILYGIFGIAWIIVGIAGFLYANDEITKILVIFVASILASYYIMLAVRY